DQAERQIATAFNSRNTQSLVQNETLEVNFRSYERIVSFNNLLYKYAPNWLQKRLNDKILSQLGEEQYDNWWIPSGNHDTIIRAYSDAEQRMPVNAPKQEGGSIEVAFIEVTRNNHRLQAVKDEALSRLSETLFHWISSGVYQPSQIGILVRTNGEAREIIQYVLERQREAELFFDVISGDALALVNSPAVRLLIN